MTKKLFGDRVRDLLRQNRFMGNKESFPLDQRFKGSKKVSLKTRQKHSTNQRKDRAHVTLSMPTWMEDQDE